MSPQGRTALLVLSAGALVAGAGLLLYPEIRRRLPPATGCPAPPNVPTPYPWPCTFEAAKGTLIALSLDWWRSIGNPNRQRDLHLEAEAIRQAFPGAGPPGGYTCEQLADLGLIPKSECPILRQRWLQEGLRQQGA